MTRPAHIIYVSAVPAKKNAAPPIFLSCIKENEAVNRRVGIIFAHYSSIQSALYTAALPGNAVNNCRQQAVNNHITVLKTGCRHSHQVSVTITVPMDRVQGRNGPPALCQSTFL